MKILQVTTHINIGGIANYILNLSESLKAKGYDVIIASSGGNLEGEFRALKIPHRRLNIDTKFEFSPKVIISAFRLADIIRKEKIDIIHAHTRVSQVCVFFASRMTGVPYVTTCHGYFKLRARKIFDTWGRRVIAISAAVKDHLKHDLGVGSDRISLIYSGVDIDKFSRYYSDSEKDEIKSDLGLKTGPVIGTIGRLSQVKGQRYLVQAMPYILERAADAQCIIVGSGEEAFALENLANALNVKNAVCFIPSNIDTAKFLSIMDVFVFPSVKEGLGMALLEAMAAGKACVASDIGGIRDIIQNDSCGMRVPVGDIKAIANSVIALLGDKNPAKQMGSNARRFVAEQFSLDAMRANVIQLYKEVLDEKK